MIYPNVREINKNNSIKVNILNASFPFDRRRKETILQYFQWKEQMMKQSPFKIIILNSFKNSPLKNSFLIYEYTQHRQFCKKENNQLIYISTCPFQNCHFTCNSSLVDRADAILMLFSHLNYKKVFDLNRNRNPNQIWLLWHDEPYSPSSIYNKFRFNWTISYRLDSEVNIAAYGITFLRNQPMNQLTFTNWINQNYKKRRNEASW
jgi:hypothetical protein